MPSTDVTITQNTDLDEAYRKVLAQVEPERLLVGPFEQILNKEVEAFKEAAKRASQHHAFIHRYYAQPFNRLISRYLTPLGVDYSWEMTYGRYGTTLRLSLAVDKLSEVVPLLRLLAAEGLAIIKTPDDSDSTTKYWRLYPRGLPHSYDEREGPRLSVAVTAKRCKRVQTGTQEVPVYETKCEWGAEETTPELEAGE